ncbi:hypothetical protein FKM82_024344 [Ascaphus truei]
MDYMNGLYTKPSFRPLGLRVFRVYIHWDSIFSSSWSQFPFRMPMDTSSMPLKVSTVWSPWWCSLTCLATGVSTPFLMLPRCSRTLTLNGRLVLPIYFSEQTHSAI